MERLRSLPRVDVLSRTPGLSEFPEKVRTNAARRAIARIRAGAEKAPEAVAIEEARAICEPRLRPAINLTGVILHTGLGRARLASAAVEAVAVCAVDHSLLEIDEETGKRGNRQHAVRDLLVGLTGAEDALVLNNAAAALVATLTALAKGKEVILSRGQMVEIGGSFRMPDIVRSSGCRLVEVGCTNKTRLEDYEQAITAKTGAILRCHTSNFKVVGFTEHPSAEEIAKVARNHSIPCIDDMGTGCLVNTELYGIPKIPTIGESLVAGADIVIASGDKLLGGPQAGLILGNARLISKIARSPLARAMRIDKLCLAALEATLRLYGQGREVEIPTIRYLSRSSSEVRVLADIISSSWPGSKVAEGLTEIGGGSAPGIGIPTFRVGLSTKNADGLARKLRQATPAILGRIEQGAVWLDPRTLDDDEVRTVCEVLKSL